MLLSIRHRTEYRYEPAAARVALRLKLFPARTESQTPRSWSVTVNGEAPQTRLVNGFGDEEAIWIAHGGAEAVEVVAAGLVETRDLQGVLKGLQERARPAVFLRDTPLTEPDEAIRELAGDATSGLAGVSVAHALSAAVRDAVDYRPGSTASATTAAEALRDGAGVCQDHAHVLIAAARALGMPARYVVGYLFVGDDFEPEVEGEEIASSENESHAWAEIWVDGLGWVGFDAANRICPTDRYVRVAAGLDARDAAPLRGAVFGATEEAMDAEVRVALDNRGVLSQQQ
ncbi:MAG: transglutaminase family protein [Pseudomonadota bacterium]